MQMDKEMQEARACIDSMHVMGACSRLGARRAYRTYVRRLTSLLKQSRSDTDRLRGELTQSQADVGRLRGELTQSQADVGRLRGELATVSEKAAITFANELAQSTSNMKAMTDELKKSQVMCADNARLHAEIARLSMLEQNMKHYIIQLQYEKQWYMRQANAFEDRCMTQMGMIKLLDG